MKTRHGNAAYSLKLDVSTCVLWWVQLSSSVAVSPVNPKKIPAKTCKLDIDIKTKKQNWPNCRFFSSQDK